MRRLIAIFCLMLTSLTAMSKAATAEVPAQVLAEFQSFVRITPRAFYTYSYVTKDSLNYWSRKPARETIQDHVKDAGDLYWDTSTGGNNIPGLYLALDPTSSRIYGLGKSPRGFVETAYVLYRVEIPANFRVLDISEAGMSKLPPMTSDYFQKNGCLEIGHLTRFVFLKNSGLQCRSLALQILRAIDVDAIEYEFPSDQELRCGTPVNLALILLHPSKLQKGSTAIFESDHQETVEDVATHRERIILRRILADGRETRPSWINNQYETPLFFEDNASEINSATEKYKADHFLSCATP